nr:hypothetical protein [Pseudomonas asturiensis]
MALIQSLKWCLINRIAGKPLPTKTVSIQLIWCCLKNKRCVFPKVKNASSMRRRLSRRSFAEHTVGGGLSAIALIQSLKWCLRNRIAGKPPPTKNGVDSVGRVLFEEQALRVSQGEKRFQYAKAVIQEVFR